MKEKMKKEFQTFEGGLFSDVEKADVGDSYQKLGEQGVALMGWADPFTPDFSLPEHVMNKTLEAIRLPLSAHYTAPVGNDELKELIAEKCKAFNHLDVDPRRNIIITPGSDSALFFAMFPFIEKGDEVMIPSPSYPNNFTNVKMMQGKVVPIPLYAEDGYQLRIEEFEKRVTSKTKMVVLTHPNNPTTTVYNRKSLEDLSSFIQKHDLILVCDQAFEDFTFENEMITPASLPGMMERTITVCSVSKGMGLSGYRVGYIVADDKVMDVMYGCAVSVIGATNTIAQVAVMEAFKDPSFMDTFKRAYDVRRHRAYEILNEVPGVHVQLPQSGFLCWVDVSGLGNSSDICAYLIKEAKVALNDGVNYGPGGEGHLRIVLGVYEDDQKVIDALNRMADALRKYCA
ncbi:MAG: pyridoxal phosphate-dependent aminotransferase [Erysipelotrichaceae bacterium]|jgi:aspartate/methionine/tyrosine aminotransferase|nr:pyridoxal phosphate-dependent aminotransferase [Erysipelotrichaceae bacterium]